MSQSEARSGDFNTLLRDIFYSEELKIDSQFVEKLKAKIDKLCSDKVLEEQVTVFRHCLSVEADIKT